MLNDPVLGHTTLSPLTQPVSGLNLDKPIVVGEIATPSGQAGSLLNTILNNGYAGFWGWSYNSNGTGDKLAIDWSTFTPWEQAHAAAVRIPAPGGASPASPTAKPATATRTATQAAPTATKTATPHPATATNTRACRRADGNGDPAPGCADRNQHGAPARIDGDEDGDAEGRSANEHDGSATDRHDDAGESARVPELRSHDDRGL